MGVKQTTAVSHFTIKSVELKRVVHQYPIWMLTVQNEANLWTSAPPIVYCSGCNVITRADANTLNSPQPVISACVNLGPLATYVGEDNKKPV